MSACDVHIGMGFDARWNILRFLDRGFDFFIKKIVQGASYNFCPFLNFDT